MKRRAGELVHVETEREHLTTTPEHPFATLRSRWLAAGDLVPGDRVISATDGAVRVVSVRREALPRPVQVFNLGVDRTHAYFVGGSQILVHNTGCQGYDLRRQRAIERDIQAAQEQQGLLQRELAGLREALHELEQRGPNAGSRDGQARTELESRIKELAYEIEKLEELISLKSELGELEKTKPTSEAHRAQLQAEKAELALKIQRNRHATYVRAERRRRRGDPVAMAGVREVRAKARKRILRTKDYVNDAQRNPDTLDLLEQELARLGSLPPSPERTARIAHLKERLALLNRIVQLRRDLGAARNRIWRAAKQRAELVKNSEDTTAVDRRLALEERERRAVRVQLATTLVQELLVQALLDPESRDDDPGRSEARLRELDRELADAANMTEARLDQIERELGNARRHPAASAPDPAAAALRERLDRETSETNESLRRIEAELQRPTSPERAHDLHTAITQLQQELRGEHRQVQEYDVALSGEAARLQRALEGAGSSDDPAAIAARLAEVANERSRIRAEWQRRMQQRLDDAREQLRTLQRSPRLYDEAAEAELAQKIVLLEYELAASPF